MSNPQMKNKKNVPGKFYCTSPDDTSGSGCIACGMCYGSAPDFFAEDENGNGYVHKQPSSSEDIQACEDAMNSCPVSSIGNNG